MTANISGNQTRHSLSPRTVARPRVCECASGAALCSESARESGVACAGIPLVGSCTSFPVCLLRRLCNSRRVLRLSRLALSTCRVMRNRQTKQTENVSGRTYYIMRVIRLPLKRSTFRWEQRAARVCARSGRASEFSGRGRRE